MGKTMVEAFVTGESGIRRFDFLVDTGSSFMGLPLEDIEALGLPKVPEGRYRLIAAMGIMESDSYAANVRIGEDRAPALVIVSPVPIIGYALLQHLRMRVNTVTEALEKVPEDEETIPPLLLI